METYAKRKSTSPCLLAIPAFDRVAGLKTDTLTLTGEYAYANDFEVRLRALTDLTRLVPRRHWNNLGREILCLVGYMGSEPRMVQSQTATYSGA